MGYALPSDINAMIYRKLKNVYVIFNSERFSLDIGIFFSILSRMKYHAIQARICVLEKKIINGYMIFLFYDYQT